MGICDSASKWIDTYFNFFHSIACFCFYYLLINKIHPWWSLDKWKVSHFGFSCFLIGHVKERLTLILKDKIQVIVFSLHAQLLHGWLDIVQIFQKRKRREKHLCFGSEASHGKFHPQRIIFHKYASSKWQCDYNRIHPWIYRQSLAVNTQPQAYILGPKKKKPCSIGSLIILFPLGLRLLPLNLSWGRRIPILFLFHINSYIFEW